jgi:hypothetical protein
LDHVVAALDATVEVAPERAKGIIAVAFEIEEPVPVLVVGDAGTTHPEVITHDLCIAGQVVIGCSVPVGPVQRRIGRGERLAKVLVISIIFVEGFTRRIRYLEEILTAGGEKSPSDSPNGESGYQISCDFYNILFHTNFSFSNYIDLFCIHFLPFWGKARDESSSIKVRG